MNITDEKIERNLQVLRQKYLGNLVESIQDMKDFIADGQKSGLSSAQKDKICSIAHKLIGSGATYGFSSISEAARTLEDAFEKKTCRGG